MQNLDKFIIKFWILIFLNIEIQIIKVRLASTVCYWSSKILEFWHFGTDNFGHAMREFKQINLWKTFVKILKAFNIMLREYTKIFNQQKYNYTYILIYWPVK